MSIRIPDREDLVGYYQDDGCGKTGRGSVPLSKDVGDGGIEAREDTHCQTEVVAAATLTTLRRFLSF